MADPEFWRRTEAKFRRLQPTPPQPGEAQHDSHNGLYAHWTPAGWSDSGKPWRFSNDTDAIKTFFKDVAESAAVELGQSGGEAAVFYWLDLLRRDSPYFKPSPPGGYIYRVCDASAEYCLKCETNAKAARLREATESPIPLAMSRPAMGLANLAGKPQSTQFETYESFLASFPQAVRAAVEAEQRRAKSAFDAARQGASDRRDLKKHVTTYIMRVFLAFASAACKLGLNGQFEIRHIEATCRQFLRLLAGKVYGEEVWPDRGALGKAGMRNSKSFAEMLTGLENTPEWEKFRDEYRLVEEKLLADLDQQAKFEPPWEPGDNTATDFPDLPENDRDLLAATELDAVSMVEAGQGARNWLVNEANDLGVDFSGIGFSSGSMPLEAAGETEAQCRGEWSYRLFVVAAVLHWKLLKPDVDAFSAKLIELWKWAYSRFQLNIEMPNRVRRDWQAWALRERARFKPEVTETEERIERSEDGEALDWSRVLPPTLPPGDVTVEDIEALNEGPRRREAVAAFIAKCNQETRLKVTKTHIWRAVGHAKPRQFQYWQAGEDRLPGSSRGATESDDRNFRRIISMTPAEFLALLTAKGIS